jgi:hypothetical protein
LSPDFSSKLLEIIGWRKNELLGSTVVDGPARCTGVAPYAYDAFDYYVRRSLIPPPTEEELMLNNTALEELQYQKTMIARLRSAVALRYITRWHRPDGTLMEGVFPGRLIYRADGKLDCILFMLSEKTIRKVAPPLTGK